MNMKRSLMLAGALVLATSTAQAAHPDASYTVYLNSLNNSGITGAATVVIDENILTVVVRATGAAANTQYAQHLHGKDTAGQENTSTGSINATCPTLAADTDSDNIISIPEGADAYGGVIMSLSSDGTTMGTFPTSDADGNIVFAQTYTLGMGATPGANGLPSTARVLQLEDRHIVLHSADAGATPAACGQLIEQ